MKITRPITQTLAALLSVLTLAASSGARAEGPVVASRATYLETMGPALTALNFEGRLGRHFTARAGIGRLHYDTSLFTTKIEEAWVAPVTLSFLSGRRSSHFEAGAGVVLGGGEVGGIVTVGYRYQNPGNGWLVRAGASAVVFDGGAAAGPGLSIGRSW